MKRRTVLASLMWGCCIATIVAVFAAHEAKSDAAFWMWTMLTMLGMTFTLIFSATVAMLNAQEKIDSEAARQEMIDWLTEDDQIDDLRKLRIEQHHED